MLTKRRMDSDSEVDMSWIELVSGPPRSAVVKALPPRNSTEIATSKSLLEEANLSIPRPIDTTELVTVTRVTFPHAFEVSNSTDEGCADETADRFTLLDASMEATQSNTNTNKNGKKAAHYPMTISGCLDEYCWDESLTPLMTKGRSSILTYHRILPLNFSSHTFGTSAIDRRQNIEARYLPCEDTGRLAWRAEDQRPYAQPPMFNYDRFTNEFVPSDKMIRDMFPEDPAGRTEYRDVQTELELLNMFSDWADSNLPAPGIRDDFHVGLCKELDIDLEDLEEQFDVIERSLTSLQAWQKEYLDMDGDLTYAQWMIDRRVNIFGEPGGEEAWQRYRGRLERVPADKLATWEYENLPEDGNMDGIVQQLRDGENPFRATEFGAREAAEKYKHIIEEVEWEKSNGVINGDLTLIKRRLEAGEDVFATCRGRCPEAKIQLLTQDLPWAPKHDLKTWELFHLEQFGHKPGTMVIEAKLEVGKPIFESIYWGGLQAREKYGIISWEKLNLQLIGVSTLTANEVFSGWDGDCARRKYGHLYHIKPAHNLETWERFHLVGDGGGTKKVHAMLQMGLGIFDLEYWGGVAAREKYGYLLWTHIVAQDRETPEGRLKNGQNIFEGLNDDKSLRSQRPYRDVPHFPLWAGDSAKTRNLHIMKALSRYPEDDLETWEWFHLGCDPDKTFIIRDKLARGHMLFEKPYFGAEAARRKYGYILWEKQNFGADGSTFGLGQRLNNGMDIFYCGDPLREWAWKSAKELHGGLLESLSLRATHDVETWEWFHLDQDGKGIKNVLRLLYSGENYVFSEAFWGGSQAQMKYGWLRWKTEFSAHIQRLSSTLTTMADIVGSGQDIFKSRESSFTSWGTDVWVEASAREKYGFLLAQTVGRPLKNDLETWEWVRPHFDQTSAKQVKAWLTGGTEQEPQKGPFTRPHFDQPRAKQAKPWLTGGTQEEPQKGPFTQIFLGAEAAEMKYHHLLFEGQGGWEDIYVTFPKAFDTIGEIKQRVASEDEVRTGNTAHARKRLLAGEDIFYDSKGIAALSKYKYLLDDVPRYPKHDLETWEWFHLDDDGNAKPLAELRAAYKTGVGGIQVLFERNYFGGVEARSKWGHLLWEAAWIEETGATWDAERDLRDGIDIFDTIYKSRTKLDRKELPRWAVESARIKYGFLLGILDRVPQHNLETWERFHFSDRNIAKLRQKLLTMNLLSRPYFGAEKARAKYGHLVWHETRRVQ